MSLLERCIDTLHGYFELGNSVVPVGAATVVTCRECPQVYDANCATRVRAESDAEIDAALAGIDHHHRDRAHRCVKVDPLTPPAFEARLVLDGFRAEVELQSVLDGPLRRTGPAVDLRPVVGDDDWVALARLIRWDHEESAAKAGRECWDQVVTDQMVEQKRRKAPDVQFFLARVDGEDGAFFSSWPGHDAVGKVEDLFTAPPFRHRGIATALISHAVEDARGRGAGPVLIGAVADDTPKAMYAELGFRPLLVYRSYVKV